MAILGFALTEAIALLYETTRAYWGYIGYFLTYKIAVPNCKSLDYRGISNDIYLTMCGIIFKSLSLFKRVSFSSKWQGFKPKNYLQTKIIRNVVDNQFRYKTSRILKCNDLIQTLMCPNAWSVARRHITYLYPLRETNKKDDRPAIITTVTPLKSNGLVLTKSKVSVRKSNIEDTTRTNRIKFVEGIQNCFNNHSKTFENLFSLAFAEETLLMAWYETSKKDLEKSLEKNSSTKLNKVLFCKIKEISTCLTNSQYKFGVLKKAWIHTKNINKQHLVTIMSPCDKIVIHSIYMVFQFIFDGLWHDKQLGITKNYKKMNKHASLKPWFYGIHFGIELGKSCHEVLSDVQTWHFCSWFIQININKFFDKVNHNRLLNLLRETIDDEPLLTLIRQILNKEIFFKNSSLKSEKNAGIPHTNNFGILLANIYLNKLDQFILKRKKVSWDKNHSIKNCIRWNRTKTSSTLNNALNDQKYNFAKIFRQQKIQIAKQMGFHKIKFSKKKFRRIYYTRYTDNFLLGIRGPKFLAVDVRDETSQFIRCNLQLELQIAEIYHIKSGKVMYIGFHIQVLDNKRNDAPKIKSKIAFLKLKNKLRQKKLMQQTRGKTFLHKKMIDKADWVRKQITHRIKPNGIINQLIKRELLDEFSYFTWKSSDILNSKYKHQIHMNELLLENTNKEKSKSELINNTYSKSIYKTLCSYKHCASPVLYAPRESITRWMRNWGMINAISNKPIPNKMLFKYHDLSIILYYRGKAIDILEYYKPAQNFYLIKKQVNYHMRYSLLFTLAKKHKTSTSKIVQVIGKNASIYINNGFRKLKKVASFLTPLDIRNKKNGFSHGFNYIPDFKKLREPFFKTSIPKTLYHECQMKHCKKNNVKIFHLRAICQKISPSYVMGSIKIHGEKVVEFALHKKRISLCDRHYLALHTGKLFLEDLRANPKSFKLLNFKRLDVKF